MTAPICMNCKHFSNGVEVVGFSRPFRINVFRCKRNRNGPVSLVTGEALSKPPTCTNERKVTFTDKLMRRAKCGPTGKHFEGIKQ